MRKNFFLVATAVVALCCSCNKQLETAPASMGQNLIGISPVASLNTKAAIDGTIFPDDRTILMSAYYNAAEGTSANYFSGITFAKSGSTWQADKYWPLTGTLDFFGYSVDGLTPTSTTYDSKVSEGVTLALPDNSSTQTDVMFASAAGQSYASSGTAMAFRHAQALITFNAKCNTAYDATNNFGITITKITLNDAKYSGTLAMKATPTDGSYCTWSSLGDSKDVDIPGISSYNVTGTMSSLSMGIGNTGLMVPEQAQTSFTVFFTLHNGKDGSGNAVDNTLQYTYTCTGDWVEAKKYNYELSFNVNQLTVNPSVSDWVVEPVSPSIPEVVSAGYAVSGLTSVTLPTATMASNTEVMVNWGDGQSEAFTNATKGAVITGDEVVISHTYSSAYTGSVSICVRSGSLDFGELETAEYEKFTVYDDTKILVSEAVTTVLSGIFTVNASGKTVKFSKGNLMANVNSDGTAVTEWKLADNQYDYVGDTEAQQQCKGGWVDLFGWTAEGKYSDGVKQYGINTSTTVSDYILNGTSDTCCDWGSLVGTGLSMLSESEWQYLFDNSIATPGSTYSYYSDDGGELGSPWVDGLYTDAEAEALYNQTDKNYGTFAEAVESESLYNSGNSYLFKIAGVPCLILKPDGWSGTVNDGYTASEWITAQSAGLVALPCAGSHNGTSVYYVGYYGACWSSSPYEDDVNCAYCAYFEYPDAYVYYGYDRYFGFSVRLVSVQ